MAKHTQTYTQAGRTWRMLTDPTEDVAPEFQRDGTRRTALDSLPITLNLRVVGSIPTRLTIDSKGLSDIDYPQIQ
jgi:hypothetical protein